MHLIVTGGAGFIGSNLVQTLGSRHPSAWISVVDDFSSASFSNLRGFHGDVIAKACEELAWREQFGSDPVDVIYHLASITDTTVRDQRQMIERNVEGFRRVLRFAQETGARVVYASSAATYGLSAGVMKEQQPPAPANVYGFSKCILDNLAAHQVTQETPIAGVRYFNVYGPNEAHKGKMASMIYQLYCQMKSGAAPRLFSFGEQRRDFVYVKDAVEATILAGESRFSGVVNVGSGFSFSFNEIVQELNRCLGTDFTPDYIDNPYVGAYQDFTQADLTKANAHIGYHPMWPPVEGIADYAGWLEKQDV